MVLLFFFIKTQFSISMGKTAALNKTVRNYFFTNPKSPYSHWQYKREPIQNFSNSSQLNTWNYLYEMHQNIMILHSKHEMYTKHWNTLNWALTTQIKLWMGGDFCDENTSNKHFYFSKSHFLFLSQWLYRNIYKEMLNVV